MMKRLLALAFLLLALPARADDGPAYGPQLEGYDYPHPISHFRFQSQGAAMDMAYMDVKPANPNGRVIVLLHGKNFCAATWEGTIRVLTGAGYRIIAPDQVGFCKSIKPAHYQYSFEQLAANTHALLMSLGINRVTIMGHSMGGMLATRYALVYPGSTEQLVSVNPLGLEDGRAKGVPPTGVDQLYQSALKTTADSIREYERTVYYAGTWKPEYEPWVQMQAGLYRGAGREAMAWNSALTSEKLPMPVLLLIGDKDTTGRSNAVPPAIRATLGNFPVMAKAAAARIAHASLVEFPDLGHSPQIQDPAAFHKALLENLIKP